MALGNNLKGIKKDSLIPEKKAKPKKAKAVAKPKVKAAVKSKAKASAKPKVELVEKATVVKSKIKKVSKPTTTSVNTKGGIKKKTTPKDGAPKVKKTPVKPAAKAAPKVDKKEEVTKPAAAIKPSEISNQNEKILIGGEDGAPITAKLIPSRRKTVRKTKLIFEGSLSLIEAEAIKDCLVTTFTDYDIIDIQLENITHLDIIPIQMINVFIGCFPDKKVKVDSDLPFDMKIIVDRAGFGPLMFKEEAA